MTTAQPRVRLLLDERLAPKLVDRLADCSPGAAHVLDLGLLRADDRTVWSRALDGGWVIATKDDDSRQLSVLHGAPPRVIWRRLGHRRTSDVERVLRSRQNDVDRFLDDVESAVLLLARVG
jgi:predicted nuclease of predicted toxin-antitoxin system